MRRQQDLPLHAGYGTPPGRGYRTHGPPLGANKRPATQGNGNGIGRLPSIFDNPASVVMPIDQHQETSLGLDIKAMPTLGTLPVQSVPRLPQNVERKMLSSSDTTANRLRQASKGYTPSQYSMQAGLAGDQQRRRYSQPTVVPPVSDRRRGTVPQDHQHLGLLSGHFSGLVKNNVASGPLPPINIQRDDDDGGGSDYESRTEDDSARTHSESSVTGSEEDSDDEDFIDTASEAPPSRPGFESESEKSIDILQAPFPAAAAATCNQFPVTLHQDQAYVNMQRFMATVSSTGLSHRVNNIVRAFEIHGQLDKGHLTQALNKVVKLHPLLSARFLMKQSKLYAEINSQDDKNVELDVPVVGHEQADDLILNARRKLFSVHVETCSTPPEMDLLTNVFSVTSMNPSAENSPTLPNTKHPSRKRTVSFASDPAGNDGQGKQEKEDDGADPETDGNYRLHHLPPIKGMAENSAEKEGEQPLLRAKLVSGTTAKHILVLSFPRIVCDFWSSCLFVQQLADCYGKLEKTGSYRPSITALRAEKKRQGVLNAYEKERRKNHLPAIRDSAGSLMRRRAAANAEVIKDFSPMVSPRLKFQQVALRERQLLLMAPRENVFAFWEAVVTTTIKQSRGTNRIKIVPPVRIPSGLGERQPMDLGRRGRPQTSRLRPLTASRNRPMTGRRQMGGAIGDVGVSREALLGPKTKFHFIKIEDVVCEEFNLLLSESSQVSIKKEDRFHLFTLGVYILLLARCCRGWGRTTGHASSFYLGKDAHLLSARLRQVGYDIPQTNYRERLSDNADRKAGAGGGRGFGDGDTSPAVGAENYPQMRGERRGAKLDAGTFLIGIESSLRYSEPEETAGLFGPLTNDVGIRITLSSSETFADFLGDLNRIVQLANRHGHHPFQPIAEEFGLLHGLPIKFSYLRHNEVTQLSNPNDYFYIDTAVGVVKKGLARIGSNCFLTPINSKMDDDTHLELVLWESYDLNDSLAGGLRYQPQVIRAELVEAFGTEFCRLLAVVASNPSIPLLGLAREMHPPFLSGHSRARERKRTAHRP